MKVFEKRQAGNRVIALSDAIADSVQCVERDGELEKLRAQIDSQAEAFGKLFAYVVNGDHTDEAKANLVNEVLSYRYTVGE